MLTACLGANIFFIFLLNSHVYVHGLILLALSKLWFVCKLGRYGGTVFGIITTYPKGSGFRLGQPVTLNVP